MIVCFPKLCCIVTTTNFYFTFPSAICVFLFIFSQTSTPTSCLRILLESVPHNCFSSPLIEFILHHHIHLCVQQWVHSLQNFYQGFFGKTFSLLLIALNVHTISLVFISLLNSNCGNFFYLNYKAHTWTILAACCLVMSTMLSAGLLVEAIVFASNIQTFTRGNKFWLYSLFSVFLLLCYFKRFLPCLFPRSVQWLLVKSL